MYILAAKSRELGIQISHCLECKAEVDGVLQSMFLASNRVDLRSTSDRQDDVVVDGN